MFGIPMPEFIFLLVLQIALFFWAILDLTGTKFSDSANKVIWALVILFVPLLGPIAYLVMIGASRQGQRVATPRQPRKSRFWFSPLDRLIFVIPVVFVLTALHDLFDPWPTSNSHAVGCIAVATVILTIRIAAQLLFPLPRKTIGLPLTKEPR